MILDTNVLIDLNSPYCPAQLRHRMEQAAGPLNTTAINWGELMYGLLRGRSNRRWELFSRFTTELLPQLEVLPFDQECSEVMARLRVDLEARGQRLDTSDLMIAATALRHGETLITGNTRHFARVPGLRLENWLMDEGFHVTE